MMLALHSREIDLVMIHFHNCLFPLVLVSMFYFQCIGCRKNTFASPWTMFWDDTVLQCQQHFTRYGNVVVHSSCLIVAV